MQKSKETQTFLKGKDNWKSKNSLSSSKMFSLRSLN